MDIARGVGVLVVQGSKVLTATRTDNGTICGPGGHVDFGEDLRATAIRETREEFGIDISEMELLGELSGMPKEYCNSTVYLCTKYEGTPTADGVDKKEVKFVELVSLLKQITYSYHSKLRLVYYNKKTCL